MKKIVVLFLCLFLLSGCERDKNTLVMVTEAGFAPYEYYENNKIVGVDIDVAKEIANRLDKKLVIKDIDFDSIINELNSGKADFALAGISITEERKEEIDFSIEYAVSKQVIVALKDTNIKSVDDLKNKKIAVQLGSVADIYASKIEGATIIQQKKYLSIAEDVKRQKADCLIMDVLPAQELIKNNSELTILDVELFEDKYAVAVKKGNSKFLSQINEILKDVINSGKIDEFTLNHTNK